MSDPQDPPAATTPIGHWRNALTIFLIYAYIACIVLAALWFFRWRENRIPWWIDIPVGFLAIGLIGPAQHRLLILGQEACLGCLFRPRWLNELAGDWLIHFPFSTATHHMRHLVRSHYEFPDDPARDADLIIATRAGFWPLRPGRLLRLTAEEAAMAKWWCTELQKRVADQCVQLHGGYGYMNEYAVGRAYTDARVTSIYGGTTEIMKEIIGRSMGF